MTQELIDRFHVNVVVQGSRTENHLSIDGSDPYEVPKKLGIYRTVDSGNDMTTERIIERIIDHRYLRMNYK